MQRIVDLTEKIEMLDPPLRDAARELFAVSRMEIQPSPNSPRHREHGAGGHRVLRIVNRWTYEEASFDEKRIRRSPAEDDRFQQLLASCQETSGRCWFCPVSAGGRLPEPNPGQYCWTVDPKARFDGYHTLVVFTEHNPLHYKQEAIADYLRTGDAWANAVYKHLRDTAGHQHASYLFTWNSLSGSVVHGHAQVALSVDFPYGRMAWWAEAARRYRAACGRDYFEDLWEVHRAVGAGVQSGAVQIMASLTPIKERESLLYLRPEEAGDAPELLARALEGTLRALQTGAPQGLFSFNLAVYRAPLGRMLPEWEGFPIVVRIVDRGWPLLGVVDMASMELYGSSIVASDPLQFMDTLRGHLQTSGAA